MIALRVAAYRSLDAMAAMGMDLIHVYYDRVKGKGVVRVRKTIFAA